MTLLAGLAAPALPARSESALPTLMATGAADPLSLRLQRPAPVPEQPYSDPILHLHAPAVTPNRWTVDFTAKTGEHSAENMPRYLMQRGKYAGNGFGLVAEMGDLRISETPNTAQGLSRRGGRMAFFPGNSGSTMRMETFAASGGNGRGSDGMLIGATGEISVLADAARFKTIYLSGRETLPGGKSHAFAERRGDVLGLLAVLEPLRGKLAAEAELDFAVFDRNTEDDSAAVRDSASRLKLGGAWGKCRYSALYERTGPDYRLLGGMGPRRDQEGIALALATGLQLHAFDFKLSRYHDNTDKSELYPRLYRYEGFADYTFSGIRDLPLGLQYRKTFIDSAREPLGFLPKESEEEALSGRVNYLAGKWEFGVHAGFWQRSDRLREEREATAATLAFVPKFAAGPVTIAPDFSLKRSKDFITRLYTDHYAVNLGINGSLLESKLDYEVKGGFRKERTDNAYGKETLRAKVRAAYPLAGLFQGTRLPSVGIRGEYNGISDPVSARRDSVFSLLLSVEGGIFM